MIATSAQRVPEHTAPQVNQRIGEQTQMRIAYYREHPDLIDQRLGELDREWDVERALETGSATLSLLGLVLGLTRSQKWLMLPLAVQGFFLQHALQGWCPPLPVFRRMGFRTPREIDEERRELLAIRQGR